MKFFKKRESRISPEELDQQTDAVNNKLEADGPRMNAVAAYLERRKNQNGFGEDFELTLVPRRAS